MGVLTRAQIITEGLSQASRPDLADDAIVPLQAWLRSMAAVWPWPQIQRRITGISLAAAATSLAFGNGTPASVTEKVQRIRDPIWIYASGYTTRQQMRVQPLVATNLDHDETVNNPSTNRGIPTLARVRWTSEGRWTLYPVPVPDRALLLAVDYEVIPADPGASDVLWYPNDQTAIAAVFAYAMRFSRQRDDYAMANDELGAKINRDKVNYGTVPGTNDVTSLDTSVFR